MLESLETYNFRNLNNKKIDLKARNIILQGNNAQGKTNFLEAIYYCFYGASFKTKQKNNIIKHKEEEFFIKGIFQNIYKQEILLQGNTIQQKIFLDQKKIERKDLVQLYPVIIFSHEDIFLIQGTLEKKRIFFDQSIALAKPTYIKILTDYDKILKNKNICLKKKDIKSVSVFNTMIAPLIKNINQERFNFITNYSLIFQNLMSQMSILKNLTIEYNPSINSLNEEEIFNILENNISKELMYGHTLLGPHKDQYIYYSEHSLFQEIGSTGQIRLASLSLKIAQSIYLQKINKKEPILLLDDVLLELDLQTKKSFLKYIPEYKQAFFTFLPQEEFTFFLEGDQKTYLVKEGNLYG